MYLELGSQTLDLTPENGFNVRDFNLGFPVIRSVMDDRPNIDGMDDRTRFYGSRVVSLDIDLVGNKWDLLDQLSPYLNPANRPFLVFEDAAQPRRVRLRASEETAVITAPTNIQRVLLQWVAPDGAAETLNQNEVNVFASVGASPGFQFDLSFNLTFPQSGPAGRTNVFAAGNARCYPVMRLFGPCTFPRIDNLQDRDANNVPKQLAFDITLGTGQFLEVDTRERTVLLGGNPSQPRYQTIDFSVSQWWSLQAGNNFVKYFPDSFSGTARAVMLYRCSFL
jgi:hypothetical protein